jgi:hypothetical protein
LIDAKKAVNVAKSYGNNRLSFFTFFNEDCVTHLLTLTLILFSAVLREWTSSTVIVEKVIPSSTTPLTSAIPVAKDILVYHAMVRHLPPSFFSFDIPNMFFVLFGKSTFSCLRSGQFQEKRNLFFDIMI